MDTVILVNHEDNQIGIAEKFEVHKSGKLHRAFSVFIFNSKNELLLQKRSSTKYHSANLWTNTCCSHPRAGEETKVAAERRLKEEMGIVADLVEKFTFSYSCKFDNGLFEHEFDHVYLGKYDKEPIMNKNEVSDYKWISLEQLKKDVEKNPDNYTYWLKRILDRVISVV